MEDKWQTITNQNSMMGEDYRSQALLLMDHIYNQNQNISDLKEVIVVRDGSIKDL